MSGQKGCTVFFKQWCLSDLIIVNGNKSDPLSLSTLDPHPKVERREREKEERVAKATGWYLAQWIRLHRSTNPGVTVHAGAYVNNAFWSRAAKASHSCSIKLC